MGRNRVDPAPDRPLKHDRLLGLIYLVVAPVLIVGVLAYTYVDHRENLARDRRLAARAELVARNSCESATILRDMVVGLLPAKPPPNLTEQQKRNLVLLREAVRRLGPLVCSPPAGGTP